jgi:hypothetical protein
MAIQLVLGAERDRARLLRGGAEVDAGALRDLVSNEDAMGPDRQAV